MSNALSVAMVTAALERVLSEALAAAAPGGVPSVGVTTLRPDMLAGADGDARGINVFLYQVAPNGHWGAAELPTRRADGAVVNRPRQALDLHYLLTFSGDESALEPQRMLGVAVTALAAQPVLSREVVRDAIEHAVDADPTSWEQFSDLAEQIDTVRLTMLPLNLEELSKLWSTFFQAPYRLSVTYHATAVLLDADLTPETALPVRARGFDVASVTTPTISRVAADSGPTDPVLPGTLLRIDGRQLRGPVRTLVRVGGVAAEAPAGQVAGARLTIALPAGVSAGVQGVQVLHPRLAGDPPVEHHGAESNLAPVTVRPVVAGSVTVAPGGAAGAVDVTVPVDPPVGRRQRVVLSLNEHHPPAGRAARAYTFLAPAADPSGPATVAEVTVPVRDVAAGDYLVRVSVDGAESVLTPGADGRYDLPRVAIP